MKKDEEKLIANIEKIVKSITRSSGPRKAKIIKKGLLKSLDLPPKNGFAKSGAKDFDRAVIDRSFQREMVRIKERKPLTATHKHKLMKEVEIVEESRKARMLRVLVSARTALANVTVQQIMCAPETVAMSVGQVRKAVSALIRRPVSAMKTDFGGDDGGVFFRAPPSCPSSDPEQEQLERLDHAAALAQSQLGGGPMNRARAEEALVAVRRMNRMVKATIAILLPEEDGSFVTKPIGKIEKSEVDSFAKAIRGMEVVEDLQPDNFQPMVAPQAYPLVKVTPRALVWQGKRMEKHARYCGYIIDALEDFRKKLRKLYEEELNRGITTHLGLPPVGDIVKWIVQYRDNTVTRREIDTALFNALGMPVNDYARWRNIGRQNAEARQQAIDSQMNARKTSMSLQPKRYRVSKDFDKLNASIIMYWQKLPSSCSFVLLDHKPHASEFMPNLQAYVNALRTVLQ